MRQFLHVALIVGLALGGAACDAFTSSERLIQITSSDDEALPDSVRAYYAKDAAQLAMRFVQGHDPERGEVELPDDRVQCATNDSVPARLITSPASVTKMDRPKAPVYASEPMW